MKKEKIVCPERVGSVGGQAVIEGVMMRGKTQYTTAVRTPDGNIITDTHKNTSIKDKYKFLGLPIIRGVVNFIEMMMLSVSTLTFAADALNIEEETKFEKWLDKHFGKSLVTFAAIVGTIFGVILAIFLFMFLPTFLAGTVSTYIVELGRVGRSIFEGVLKIGIFVAYISLISLMPDIKRTFQYHGAEHKSIFCYEAGLELTVKNVKAQGRLHPRCGTSFMIVMMILGIVISMFITWQTVLLRTIIRISILPFIVGLGYEIIKYAGKHDNLIIRILTKPGIWMQLLTTKEPAADQIEVAIVALKSALPNEFPPESIFEGIVLPETTSEVNPESPVDNTDVSDTNSNTDNNDDSVNVNISKDDEIK